MHAGADAQALLAEGLATIRTHFEVPGPFPAEVEAEAEGAARGPDPAAAERRDLTDIAFATLDPATSTDLDQAFAIEMAGADVRLRYAIADVASFVAPGGALDQEAWRRGVTVYLPDAKSGLYPSVLSEHAASLLPDGPRRAVVITVKVGADGEPVLESVERAIIRSRAKLAYEDMGPAAIPAPLAELQRRVEAAEDRRGATRVEFPEQEVVADPTRPGCLVLKLRPRVGSEEANAAMSLAANLAVANTLYAAGTGLFRVMPDPDRHEQKMLRVQAQALGVDWPASLGVRDLLRRLDPANPRHAHLVLAIRRASGGASYEPFRVAPRPWHSAMAATYAHATAPLRRLADCYVLLGTLAVVAGRPVPAEVTEAYQRLPEAMSRADQRAAQVDRAVIDLVESVTLQGREGETFAAVVIDVGPRGAKVQLTDPPVVATVDVPGAEVDQRVQVRLTAARPEQRKVEFVLG